MDECLKIWEGSGDWKRIKENIRSETALSEGAFTDFLKAFAERLQNGEPAQDAYVATCREFQFYGASWAESPPALLGRAVRLNAFVDTLVEANADAVGRDVAIGIVNRAVLPDGLNAREERILQRARIGRYVIWATFDEGDTSRRVIDALPTKGSEVATALGLGPLSADISYALIAYGANAPQNADFIVYRPTIADAASYLYYQPHDDPEHSHGYTRPLDPNEKGFSPMPEIVHRELDGLRIDLPLIIAE